MNEIKSYIAEFIGTFILVFFGTGSVVVNAHTNGGLTPIGVSLCFGLIVLVLIYAIGDISGAHVNPAVTVGFYLSKLISLKNSIFYIIFQFLGAIFASLAVKYIYPSADTLGETIPSISIWSAFVFEIILTFVLMFVVVNLSYGSKQKGITSGIAVGSLITFEALIAGPLTGASMNPARSFGPALVSMNFDSLWIYMIAPFLGSAPAIALYSYLFAEDAENNRNNFLKKYGFKK